MVSARQYNGTQVRCHKRPLGGRPTMGETNVTLLVSARDNLVGGLRVSTDSSVKGPETGKCHYCFLTRCAVNAVSAYTRGV